MTAQRSRADAGVILALGVVSFVFFQWYVPRFRAAGGAPAFYQVEFAPAVMSACGRGFVQLDADRVPALAAFLQQRTDVLRCGEIPQTVALEPLTGFQAVTRYLMLLFAFIWRFTGITWRVSDVVISGFAAATVAAAYAALRTWCSRWLSLGVVLFWAMSPRHLENAPHLRDYSKALFFMVLLVAIGVMLRERRPLRLLLVGAVFGAVQGIGFGMRTDMAMNFVPFLVVLFALPCDRCRLKTKIAGAAAAAMVFVSVSWPIIRSYVAESSLWHVALLGLTSPFDENLNIGFPRTAYRFHDVYLDRYVQTVVQAYSMRVHPSDSLPTMVTPGYDRVCREYFLRLVKAFPGDMATRAAASAMLVADLPFHVEAGREIPRGLEDSRASVLWRLRAALLRPLGDFGVLFVLAAIVAVGAVRWPYALVALLVFWYWTAVPALEFHERHTFHLEFLMLAAAAWAAAWFFHAFGGWAARPPTALVADLARPAAVVAAFLLSIGAAIAAGRWFQQPRAAALVKAYIDAPAAALVPSLRTVAADRVRLAVDLFRPATSADDVQQALVRADFDFAGCGRPTMVNATVSYYQDDARFAENFSETLALGYLGATTTSVFLPVYAVAHDWTITSRFAGIEVPASFAPCVRLARIADADRLALVLPVTIAPDWPRKLYARLRVGSSFGY